MAAIANSLLAALPPGARPLCVEEMQAPRGASGRAPNA